MFSLSGAGAGASVSAAASAASAVGSAPEPRVDDSVAAEAAAGPAVITRDATTGLTADEAFDKAMALLDYRPEQSEKLGSLTLGGLTKEILGQANQFLEVGMGLGCARAYFYHGILKCIDNVLVEFSENPEVEEIYGWVNSRGCQDVPTYLRSIFKQYGIPEVRHDRLEVIALIDFRKVVQADLDGDDKEALNHFLASAIESLEEPSVKIDTILKRSGDVLAPSVALQLTHLIPDFVSYEAKVIGWDAVMDVLVEIVKREREGIDKGFLAGILKELPEYRRAALLKYMDQKPKLELSDCAEQLRSNTIRSTHL